jgi:hypothetical protein
MDKMEEQLGQIRKYLADLELLTYGHQKVDPHSFCLDGLDRKLVDYLLHYKGATHPELAEYANINRWLVLNRLQKIKRPAPTMRKAVIDYYGGEKSGKKKAWWVNEE